MQRDWLFNGIDSSTGRWRILANSSVMSQTWAPGMPEDLQPGLLSLKLISAKGGPDHDQWDGYPVERAALLGHIAGRDTIVLSGDVHVGMAVEMSVDGQSSEEPIAAEFVTTSLTSQNLDDKKGWGYRTRIAADREDAHGAAAIDPVV